MISFYDILEKEKLQWQKVEALLSGAEDLGEGWEEGECLHKGMCHFWCHEKCSQ